MVTVMNKSFDLRRKS